MASSSTLSQLCSDAAPDDPAVAPALFGCLAAADIAVAAVCVDTPSSPNPHPFYHVAVCCRSILFLVEHWQAVRAGAKAPPPPHPLPSLS